MWRRILKRVGFGLISIFGALTIVFIISRASGDPAELLTPPGAPQEQIDATREQLGLDRPVIVQYVDFLGDVARGDLGTSYYWQEDVTTLIRQNIWPTVQLALVALIYASLLGITFGLMAAFRRGRAADRVLTTGSMLGQAIPSFWLAPVLILVFAVHLGWFPATGSTGWKSVVLPAIALGTFQFAVFFRVTRAAAIEALGQDFVRLARAKGVGNVRLAVTHVLPNTALPLMTVGGIALATLIGGSVIVETIFAWPGLGSIMMRAVLHRDFPVVQGIAIVFAVAFVVINTTVDALYAVVDPRVRNAENR